MKRLLPPLLVLICLAAMGVLRVSAPGVMLIEGPAAWAGAAPILAGLAFLVAGSGTFRRRGTNIKTFNEPDVLVTDGLFRWTRNPMYLGFVLLLLGAAILLGSATAFGPVLLFWLVANSWYIPFEERALRLKFGDDYADYARATPRWI
jgi:protein-S-isoprenylcysteine O-methyltransferase Ste14